MNDGQCKRKTASAGLHVSPPGSALARLWALVRMIMARRQRTLLTAGRSAAGVAAGRRRGSPPPMAGQSLHPEATRNWAPVRAARSSTLNTATPNSRLIFAVSARAFRCRAAGMLGHAGNGRGWPFRLARSSRWMGAASSKTLQRLPARYRRAYRQIFEPVTGPSRVLAAPRHLAVSRFPGAYMMPATPAALRRYR